MSLFRWSVVLAVFGFVFFSASLKAGFSSPGTPEDILHAGENTHFYWSEKDNLVAGRCQSGKLISWKNCGGEDPSRRQAWNLREVIDKHLKKLLTARLMHDEKAKALIEVIAFLDQQVSIFEKQPVSQARDKKIKELKNRRDETRATFPALVRLDDVLKQFETALTTPPDLVTVAGDGYYPLAENHIDLLEPIFELVAIDSSRAAWCENSPWSGRQLWILLSKQIDFSVNASKCRALGGRIPAMEDMKGPSPESLIELDARAAWRTRDCRRFAASPFMRAMNSPLLWVSNLGYHNEIQVAQIGPEGSPCDSVNATRLNLAPGGCVIGRHEPFPPRRSVDFELLDEMPCGK